MNCYKNYNDFLPDFFFILCKHQIFLILQESEHARRSERMVDDQINIAIESRETLMSQRVAFKAIQVIFCVFWDIFENKSRFVTIYRILTTFLLFDLDQVKRYLQQISTDQ